MFSGVSKNKRPFLAENNRTAKYRQEEKSYDAAPRSGQLCDSSDHQHTQHVVYSATRILQTLDEEHGRIILSFHIVRQL